MEYQKVEIASPVINKTIEFKGPEKSPFALNDDDDEIESEPRPEKAYSMKGIEEQKKKEEEAKKQEKQCIASDSSKAKLDKEETAKIKKQESLELETQNKNITYAKKTQAECVDPDENVQIIIKKPSLNVETTNETHIDPDKNTQIKKPNLQLEATNETYPANEMVRIAFPSPTSATQETTCLLSPNMPALKRSKSPKKSLKVMSPILNAKRQKTAERIPITQDLKDFTNILMMLNERIDEEHPRNKNGKPYGLCESIFEVDTGYHCCGNTSINTDTGRMGIGITLYFKFLKYLICFFLLFTVLSIPSIYFSSTAIQKSSNYQLDSFTQTVFATTLGGIGLTNHVCDMVTFDNKSKVYTSDLFIECDTGIIDTTSLTFGLYIDATSDCDLADESLLDQECIQQTAFEQTYNASCDSQNCSLSNLTSYLINNTECQKKFENYPFYLSSICKDTKIYLILGQKEYPLDSSLVALIIGVADGLIVIFYLVMIITLTKSEKKARDDVLLHSLSASNFSLEFSNLPSIDKEKTLILLKAHIEETMNKYAKSREKIIDPKSNSPQTFKIVDLNIAEASEFIAAELEKRKLITKRNKMVIKFAKKYDPKNELKEPTIGELETFYQKIEDEKTCIKAHKEFNKIYSVEEKIVKWENVELKAQKKTNITHKAVWVTFETMRQRDLAYKYFSTSLFDHFWYSCSKCCLTNQKSFKGKLMTCSEAPDPANVKWENFTLSTKNRLIREFFSLIITLIILIIAFVIIVYIKNAKQNIMDNIPPNVDCNQFTNLTEKEVAEEYLSSIKTGKIGCYCESRVNADINNIYQQFPDANNAYVCLYWFQLFTIDKALPYAIIVVIIMINIILQVTFKALTNFERHQYYSYELGSRVVKIFVAQFLNTGILLFVMNIKFETGDSLGSQFQNLFKGTFLDISPLWFYDVGTVICMTMVINLATNPVTLFIMLLKNSCCKLIDTKCTCDKKISRKETLKEREQLYMGPEFLIEARYAQILSSIFVCMMYSTGMPVLYFTTCVQLLIFYWIDKICVLKFYRKLKNIDEKLEIYAKNMLIFGAIIHIFFGIWILGNSQIFNNSYILPFISTYQNEANSYMSNDISYSYAAKFQDRVLKTQSLLLDLLIILIVVYFVLRVLKIFTIDKMELCCGSCKRKFFFSTKNPKFAKINYFDAFTFDQIETEMVFKNIILDDLKKEEKDGHPHQEYMEFIKRQLDELKAIWEKKIIEEDNLQEINMENKFVGLPSYDLKNNEVFQNFYDIEAMKAKLQQERYEKSPQQKKKKELNEIKLLEQKKEAK